MKFDDVINTRKSIRKYLPKKVDKDTINALLESALLAPTWKNTQTGRYYVIMEADLLASIKEDCLPDFNQRNCENVPVLIITTYITDESGFVDGVACDKLGNGWGIYDLAMQNENLLLKAADLGLGTLVMGLYDDAKLHAYIPSISDRECIVSVIAVGYPDEDQPERPSRKSVAEIATYL